MRWFLMSRQSALLCLLTLWLMGTLALAAMAQNAPAPLTPDTSVSGSIDTAALARVYVFSAGAGDTASLTVTAEFPVALLLTGADGSIIGQIADVTESGSAALTDVLLAQSGSYFVTVFPAPGASRDVSGSFELALTLVAATVPEATAETTTAPASFQPSQDILVPGGMEVRLEWNAQVDLNLEIRDPQGNSLFWDARSTPIGGNFGFDANGLCEQIAEVPQEVASWVPGFLPTGSYEILVFYRQSCVTPAQPVAFTLTVTVNGTVLPVVNGTLTPPVSNQNSVYVANFVLNADATGVLNAGGVYPDTSLNILPAAPQDILAAAQPITRDTPATGAIFGAQNYLAYSFTAQADDLVSISLTRTSGSLDTLLQLVDATGALVDVNDDTAGSRNSALSNVRLLRGGSYTIVATRYGKELGGTEGEFELLLTGATGELPAEVTNLNLPQGAVEISLVWNSGADLQLLVRDPVGDAVFDDRPTVNSGGILAANGNVNCVRAQGTPVSYTYWPFLRPGTYEIEVWYQNACNDTTPVEFTLTTLVNGQVVIAERQRPQAGQRYVINFTVSVDGTAVRGQGGVVSDSASTINYQAETPFALTVNQPTIGQITVENFFDVYAFSGTAGQNITVSMNATSAVLDPKLFLISPTGVQVAQNDDAIPGTDKNALISDYTLQETGVYLVIATRYAIQYGGTVGGYTLNVQQN
ncbi:MAG: PPC domain-containing protein [Anaerolineae bacterium]|nr:PPC domain-containing protein [Anaerolineae bacterium]